MNEHVRYTVVEDATSDAVFSKDEKGKLQPEKDAGLKMVLGCRKRNGLPSLHPLRILRARLPYASRGDELGEAKNYSTGAVLGYHQHLPQRKLRRVVAPAQSA